MTDITTLRAWRSEAQAALHQLVTGALVASCTRLGRTVSYTQANVADLRSYISDLDQQIATAAGTTPARRINYRIQQTGSGY